MYAYFTENNLIQPRQSGFRSLHSTVTALLDMTNQWCLNIDKGMVSGVIFLDLKKAFDTVDHAILLKKLCDYGVQGQTASWFKSFLKERQQFCVVNGLFVCKKSYRMWRSTGFFIRPTLVCYLH